nr:Protein MSO1 [Zygosaccharomyces rouxii]
MSASSDHSQHHFWSKFRSSTKSLQSSLAGLSLKGESDGDSPNSTVVHKTLVKFYKHQEPFTGFPGWLGEKEDLPDQQKILKKQAEGKPSSSSSALGASIGNSWNSVRKASWERGNSSHRDPGHREYSGNGSSPVGGSERPHHTSAGMSFQRIYNKDPQGSTSSSDLRAHQPSRSLNMGPMAQSGTGSDVSSEQTTVGPTRSNTASSSSMMRDRLKRNNTKNSFNF